MSDRTRRRRAEANYGPEVGTTYLLHFDRPYRHARHYIGWTQDLAARLEAHARGRGARLVEVITRAGIGFTLARTWPETTRDREDLLKHIGGARRFCPQCGAQPPPPPAAGVGARPAAAPRAEAPPEVPGYDFADWPDLTARHTVAEAAELSEHLARGRQAAYEAAAATGAKAGPGAEYQRRFDTAIEVDLAWQKAARETTQFHGREPGQPVDKWIDQTRQKARQQRQEEEVFGRKARADERVRAEQQAEADRLFREVDRLEAAAPNYRREITAERAARTMRELGEPLARDAQVQPDEPRLQGAELDAEIDRLAGAFPDPETEPLPETEAPGEEPGVDAARWAPGGGHPQLAGSPDREPAGGRREHMARDQLDRRADEAERARQQELSAAADVRMAQRARDEHTSPTASAAVRESQQRARYAWEDRQAATAAAYEAATSLQQSAISQEMDHFGRAAPELEDAGRPYRHAQHYIGRTQAALAARLDAHARDARSGLYVRQPQAQLEAG